jgi:hypothetical protein
MRKASWLGFGLIAAAVIAGAAILAPAGGLGIPSPLALAGSSSGHTPEPNWNSGNLCRAVFNNPYPGYDQCVSYVSDSKAPLWYNFSAGKVENGVVNVTIYGSNDCVFLNFHSFDTTINLHLYGTGYTCAYGPNGTIRGGVSTDGMTYSIVDWNHGGGNSCKSGGGNGWAIVEWGSGGGQTYTCGPGINVAVNSENDVVNLVQGTTSHCNNHQGGYATNLTIYATTITVNVVQNQDDLNTTITYIGASAGFGTCPYKYENGRVAPWTEVANGDKDTFNTIFVNEVGQKHAPPNSPYTTEPLGAPDGTANGYGDVYGSETTTTAPPGTCQYIGV